MELAIDSKDIQATLNKVIAKRIAKHEDMKWEVAKQIIVGSERAIA